MYRAVTKAEQLDILSDSQIPSDTLHLALDYIAESISNPSQKVSSIEHFGGSMATVILYFYFSSQQWPDTPDNWQFL